MMNGYCDLLSEPKVARGICALRDAHTVTPSLAGYVAMELDGV